MRSTSRISRFRWAGILAVAVIASLSADVAALADTGLGNHSPAVALAAEPKESPKQEAKKPGAKKADKEKTNAEEEAKSEESKGDGKPADETKTDDSKGPELSGVFEARRTTEIALRPKSWATLKVLRAASHGQRVEQGRVLLVLDLEAIDTAIADLRSQHRIADLTMRQAEIALRELESKTPLGQVAADRARQMAREDFQQYTKVGRPLELKSANYSLRSSKLRLEYQEEELRQLEEMYKADDLTEDTEEIILQRARNNVEMARFMYEMAQSDHAKTMKYDFPRKDEAIKEKTSQAEIAWQTARGTLPLTLQKQRLDLEKLKVDRERSDEKLDKLLADRAAMIVKAPVAGILYYGQCDHGKWSSAATVEKKLRLGGTISAHEVVMTIVQERPLFVRGTLAEKDLARVHSGDKCTVIPTSAPKTELPAVVSEISQVPIDAAKFDIRVTLVGRAVPESIVPGMSCKVKFAPEEKEAEPAPAKPAGKKAVEEKPDTKKPTEKKPVKKKPAAKKAPATDTKS